MGLEGLEVGMKVCFFKASLLVRVVEEDRHVPYLVSQDR